MIASPTATAVTTPVVAFTEAIEAALLDQLPPAVLFVNVRLSVAHTVPAPAIAAKEGAASTVTKAVTELLPQLFEIV